MHKRQIRSFISRGMRMTQGQRQALDSLSPRYCLRVEDGLIDFVTVFARDADVIMDIGFGTGASLLSMAQAHPENDYLGVEVYPAGVGSLLAGVAKAEINNVHIYQCDVIDVLNQCIKDESLSGITIFFPDPWPKRKHHKRRLIQPDFIALLLHKLKPAGFLHLATDWQHYAQQMMKILSNAAEFHNEAGVGQFSSERYERPVTKFEKRGKQKGHDIWDLYFTKITKSPLK
jgi:tRNA (guanine-N7-)-methyltransferase